MREHSITLAAAIASLMFAGTTTGAPITFHFEGVVDIVQGSELDELLGPGVTAADLEGTSFHGSFTFDPDAPDDNASTQIGSYVHTGPPYGMEFHFVHRSFSFPDLTIGILDDLDPPSVTPGLLDDLYSVQTPRLPHPTDMLLSTRGLLQLLATGTDTVGPSAITSDTLPFEPPDFTTFDLARVFINVVSEETDSMGETVFLVRAGLGGTIQALRVPEPSVMLLLGLGLAAANVLRRR